MPLRKCDNCGARYKYHRHQEGKTKYCSRRCLWDNNGSKGSGEYRWYIDAKGYKVGFLWKDGEPHYKRYHRWVIEEYLKCDLLPDEDVHHKNGDKLDNRLGNLELMTHSEHSRLHNQKR